VTDAEIVAVAFEAEIDRQLEAMTVATAALPDADACATPFAALLVFLDSVRPVLAAGGEPARRRFRHALQSVIADALPEMLRPPTTPAPAPAVATPGSPVDAIAQLANELGTVAMATDTSATVRAFASVATAAQLATVASEAVPHTREALARAFATTARSLDPLVLWDSDWPSDTPMH
jgi:hypothetical protein